jgi:hypothetical protein
VGFQAVVAATKICCDQQMSDTEGTPLVVLVVCE